ncbi:MAG: PSD1 and planctomycete cytochrome C domain-containing protein [Planctomycetota bacterium]
MRNALLGASLAALASSVPAQGPQIDFNRDVRPLLSDRCFQCHGFDARARKAGLRLDTWEGLTRVGRNGVAAVVPGDAASSELVRRIHASDARDQMPPRRSGLVLSVAERALLRRWIDVGAPFERHWAFVAPHARPAPDLGAAVSNDIDAFVRAALGKRGLGPAAPADRATLIRRLSLDLLGLPPTPEDVAAFVADPAPDAYARLVERLLASPHFGERMALMWLDAARYADTNGFHHDNERTGWPYRDWVIGAFNGNLPYDEFVVQQLAGDLLEDAGEAERIASAFCRMHNINDEGGALDPEYRVEAVCDRIETVATTFMGLTFTCARCHDHKYDPITQEDYYSLYAYFNSVDEKGVYPANFEQARAYPARLDYKTAELEGALEAVAAELAGAEAQMQAAQPRIDAERLAAETALRAALAVRWVPAELVEARSAEGQTLKLMADGSVRLEKAEADHDTLTHVLQTAATELRLVRVEALTDPKFPQERVGLADHGNVVINQITATASSVVEPSRRQEVRFRWAWADHEQPNGDFDIHNTLRDDEDGWALAGHQQPDARTAILVAEQAFGFAGGTRVEVDLHCRSGYARHVVGRARVTLGGANEGVDRQFPLVLGDWFLAEKFRGETFDELYDTAFGPESIERLDRAQRFGKIGWRHQADFADGEVHRLKGELAAFYLARTVRTPVARPWRLSLGSDDAVQLYLNGEEVHGNRAQRGAAPDQDTVEVELPAGESVLVQKIINNSGPSGFYFAAAREPDEPTPHGPAALIPSHLRDRDLTERFAREFGARHSPSYAAADAKRRDLRAREATLREEIVPVLVMRELAEPVPAHVLARGRYDMADESRPVQRRPPEFLGGALPEGAPNNRLGFAQWLVREEHPLTARVHVNRIWQMLFGAGLVASAENFGHQADWPSHPELLDALAVGFVADGWDQKALIRRIVSSATYRQSSVRAPAAVSVDPGNRWLASFPRARLPGELVRDQALAVAGLLVPSIGGPSVRPYQPAGLWREVSIGQSSNTQVFERDDGEALYRRSLYTFWKRTSPNPQMSAFDAPTREFCVVRRNVTNTPLQALVLWNDVQFVEAARALALRTLREATEDDARLVRLLERCTGQLGGEGELAVLRECLAGFRQRYQGDLEAAAALLEQGETQVAPGLDIPELAAWTMVANTVLSLDATIVRG